MAPSRPVRTARNLTRPASPAPAVEDTPDPAVWANVARAELRGILRHLAPLSILTDELDSAGGRGALPADKVRTLAVLVREAQGLAMELAAVALEPETAGG